MFKNYFKTAWRNIIRSKGYSALNISGFGNRYGGRFTDRTMGTEGIFI